MTNHLNDLLLADVYEVIDAMLKQITDGCKTVSEGAVLSDDVRGYFTRRYALSIRKRLHDNNDWPNQVALDLTFGLGQVAGAIWFFWNKSNPVAHPQVDVQIIMKASHVVELECQDYLALNLETRDAKERELMVLEGGYCS